MKSPFFPGRVIRRWCPQLESCRPCMLGRCWDYLARPSDAQVSIFVAGELVAGKNTRSTAVLSSVVYACIYLFVLFNEFPLNKYQRLVDAITLDSWSCVRKILFAAHLETEHYHTSSSEYLSSL
ncbi:hypothetical protein B296_00048900 [Ensete ventricosum]|uniref:Uncharacterized protein n=1 Tax=Ensete ventricosum TaxID=4639 RepID=A0A426YST1_ENSVE|nr:hypothetical protein B296_00048900 [Ensete ventricosum]